VTGGACPPAPCSRATCQSRSVAQRLDEARGRQRRGCRGCRDWDRRPRRRADLAALNAECSRGMYVGAGGRARRAGPWGA
jgi:hypothetical protein